jgi:hypothetical protein
VTEIQEGRPGVGEGPRNTNAQSRYAFPSQNPYAMLSGPPKLQFGDQGELTHKTIEQAGLTGEEKRRAQEMLKVQAAYLEIYNSLDFPNDPDGHVVDLSGVHMTQPKVAIAWTLALLGYRPSGKAYIKKRHYTMPGVYENAYYYVDSRAAEDAGLELRPEHAADDHHLPPDTRRLAAIRDGEPGQQLPTWSVKPTVTVEDAPRPQRVNPLTGRPADTMDGP